MKLHIGCGSIYLNDGFLNIDLPCENVYLAKDRPDLVERFSTDSGDYYGRHRDTNIETLRHGPTSKDTVCDAYGWIDHLPVKDSSISEIICRQVLEHVDFDHALRGLKEMYRKLTPDGYLRISVPDHEETMKKFQESGDKFYIRHLLGPRNSDFGYHVISYTREGFLRLLALAGFSFVSDEHGIHDYPAHCMIFRKLNV